MATTTATKPNKLPNMIAIGETIVSLFPSPVKDSGGTEAFVVVVANVVVEERSNSFDKKGDDEDDTSAEVISEVKLGRSGEI